MSWTDDRIEMLKQLWGQGLTASQIAKEIGGELTRNAVIGKAHRLGLKSRPSPVKKGGKDSKKPEKTTTQGKAGQDKATQDKAGQGKTGTRSTARAPDPVTAQEKPNPKSAAPDPKPADKKRPATKKAKKVKEVIGILELSDKICKWPIGHPDDPDFHFCGAPSREGFPYCSAHCAIAYQAQLPRRDNSGRRPGFSPPGVPFSPHRPR